MCVRLIVAVVLLAFSALAHGCGASTSTTATPTMTAAAATIVGVSSPANGSAYATSKFVVPFEVTVPPWLADTEVVEESNFVTWVPSSELAPAVRFLVPLAVYPPDGAGPAAPPGDYVAYLLAQGQHGARLSDVTQATVGGRPATILTATAPDQSLDGSLGCPEKQATAEDCYGLQTELTLRIAVIDAGDATLVVWLRHANAAGDAKAAQEFSAFEAMLASVRFRS